MSDSFELTDDKILRSIIDLLKKYRLISFFMLAYLFKWLFWVPATLAENHLLPINISITLRKFSWLSVFIFCPSSVAIILTGIIEGKKGLKELFKKIILWRVNLLWYFLILFSPAIFSLAAIGLFVFTGGTPPDFMNVKWHLMLPYFLWMLVSGGPLGEELGWRGYALPILQEKNNALASSLIIGILWSLWHLPLFWIPWHFLFGFPITLFILFNTAKSVLMTWVYNNTNGSLLLAILFHTSTNVTGIFILAGNYRLVSLLPIFYFLIGIYILVVSVVVIITGPAKLSRNRSV